MSSAQEYGVRSSELLEKMSKQFPWNHWMVIFEMPALCADNPRVDVGGCVVSQVPGTITGTHAPTSNPAMPVLTVTNKFGSAVVHSDIRLSDEYTLVLRSTRSFTNPGCSKNFQDYAEENLFMTLENVLRLTPKNIGVLNNTAHSIICDPKYGTFQYRRDWIREGVAGRYIIIPSPEQIKLYICKHCDNLFSHALVCYGAVTLFEGNPRDYKGD